ncbi:CAP domain-containing protein [Stackebrandtia albiflava]|uniref:CAP domain-containing protein n=1 Tax=Stackebrandtia albiflava TaxID=406432 RepID=UPI0011BE7807|nr:CAP domain-containing protein [Stackebrandtia albiflava]
MTVLTGAGLAVAELPGRAPATETVSESSEAPSPPTESTSEAAPGVVTQPAESESPEPEPSESSDPVDGTSTPPEEDGSLASLADEAVRLTSLEREAAGCGAVTENPQLTDAAVGHSRDMAENGYFDHTSQDGRTFTDRASQEGYDHAMSENIAKGYATAADVIRGWMDSPGHRANLLDCDAEAVGMGVARDDDGSLVWTQVFGRE